LFGGNQMVEFFQERMELLFNLKDGLPGWERRSVSARLSHPVRTS
jgi:hypothetical protein